MSFETLELREDARCVVYVTLNRPDKRNALSATMLGELTEVAGTLGQRRETRAMVLAGHGPIFCAGADLDWMMVQINADRATRIHEAGRVAEMLRALNTMPTPLILRVQGGAYAGAVGIACVADIVVAADTARFSLTETRLGLIPATISPYVVARLGEGMARRITMSARRFDAAEAERLGLVARIVPEAELDDAVEAEVAPFLSVAPGAVGRAKQLLRQLGPQITPEIVSSTIAALADQWETDEAGQGIAAFLDKRPAPWA